MIDFEKFSKYSKAGPRYTSYPTAPEFHEGFNDKSYETVLKEQDSSRALSLYFHLPFCRSACYFCGCNVVYTSKEDKKERYIDYLEKELELLSHHLDTSREVIQMHFGGGTPTFFSEHQLERILKAIRRYFKHFSHDAEISCEIDPRFLSKEQLDILVKYGFNRISYGVQDFNDEVQKAIHRIQPYDVTQNAVKMAKDVGIKSINMDLIYGLPYQSFESFQETLRLAVSLDPSRLAVFNYAHVPWMKKSMRKIDETTLPHPSVKLAIMRYSIDYLQSHGYQMIGMDHFAKPEDELFLAIEKGELHRNFQGYTTKGGADLIGIGLTSIGEGLKHYVQNFKEMDAYEHAIDEGRLPVHRGLILNEDDVLRKAVIMEMMSNFKLNIAGIETAFGINFFEYFADAIAALKPFEEEDLVIVDNVNKKILVNPTGTLLIRNIVMPFDAYLQKIPEDKRRFSKTV